MTPPKIGSALCGALLSFVSAAPPELGRYAGIALWFLIADTVTGLLAARRLGTMSSGQFRQKLKDKLLCYFAILSLAGGASVYAESWAWLVAGWWAVCAGEGLSIGENLRNLLSVAGPALAPVAGLLDRLLGVFGKVEANVPVAPVAPAAPAAPTEGENQ